MTLSEKAAAQKKAAGEKAVEYIKDGMIVGLGTGSTVYYTIRKVAGLLSEGLKIQAVPTSKKTERLAGEGGIPCLSMEAADRIDLDIDGVDEIDGDFNAVKGGGGALFREKIVADMAETVIWVLDESKLVDRIGAFPLPLEVLPFGYRHTISRLKEVSAAQTLRMQDGKPFVTDNGNYIVDVLIKKTTDRRELNGILKSIPGVIETGLFLNMCRRIIVGTDAGVKIIENHRI